MKQENNFIQWKCTDLYMEFGCDCGVHNTYSGLFAYFVKCKGCGQVYKMDSKVMMEKTDEDCSPLLDIDEDL